MAGIRKKKLYFDVTLTTNTAQCFPCTQFRQSYSGDNFGGVLDDLPPLLSSTASGESQRRNSVCAWFSPTDGKDVVYLTTPLGGQRVYVRFIFPTTGPAQSLSTTQWAGLTFGSRIRGSTPIGTRHFGVLVSRDGDQNVGASPTVRGVLYVQRQHSIEI